jgi:hypothetical protein
VACSASDSEPFSFYALKVTMTSGKRFQEPDHADQLARGSEERGGSRRIERNVGLATWSRWAMWELRRFIQVTPSGELNSWTKVAKHRQATAIAWSRESGALAGFDVGPQRNRFYKLENRNRLVLFSCRLIDVWPCAHDVWGINSC